MERHAFIETLDDIAKAIKSFGDISVIPNESGGIKIVAHPYTLYAKQADALYHWTLQAMEDPSDKDEGYSSDPLGSIRESLAGETPAGNMWEQFASSPKRLSSFLRRLASDPERPDTAFWLRKAFLVVATHMNPLLDLHKREIGRLMREIESRGWRAQELDDSSGLPAIEFEIGERYEGRVMLSQVLYSYKFEVEGAPEVTENGATDSVVKSLKTWLHRKDVDDAAETAEGGGVDPYRPTVRNIEDFPETWRDTPRK
jgi:hypothetical protein